MARDTLTKVMNNTFASKSSKKFMTLESKKNIKIDEIINEAQMIIDKEYCCKRRNILLKIKA